MGEIADMMLEGILCACCGVVLVTEDSKTITGVPTLCEECKDAQRTESKNGRRHGKVRAKEPRS